MRKALLAAIKSDENIYFDELIEECKNLCAASYIEVTDVLFQTSRHMDPNFAFRKGKLDELKIIIEEKEIELVVFYNNLSINILKNLTEYLNVEILDRTNLILDIFSSRARSKEAMIQTELARLKYTMPRLMNDSTSNNKERGGSFKNRGEGEKKSNVIKRNIEKKIYDLKQELKELEKRKEVLSTNYHKSSLKKVALVGYTNAGKSSLMNTLLMLEERDDKLVYEKDQLFATLDTSVRKIKYKTYEFLLFDTVGFVSDLPHDLIEAFKSTLKVAKEADLLLHVIDSSNKNKELIKEITNETLKEIGADNIPVIEVYNKCDLLKNITDDNLYISCKDNTNIEQLLDKIIERIYPSEITLNVLVPYDKLSLISKYKNIISITKVSDEENGSSYLLKGEKDIIDEFINRIR